MEKIEKSDKPKPRLEGILYGEISAWITLVGMVIAVAGLVFGFIFGSGIIDEAGLMKDMLAGKGEKAIWTEDSVFSHMPDHYWFFKERVSGDEISMVGLIIACYGGIAGVWGMFASMFRKKRILLYKKGLFTFLALVLGVIMTLAACGVITIR